MPARSNSSARPEIRTALTAGASRTIGGPRHSLALQPVLPLRGGVSGTWPVDSFAHEAPQLCVSCLRRSGIARNTPLKSIVCGPCWFAGGGDISPTELDSAPPPEPDFVLPRTALDWYRALIASPWFQTRRRDSANRLRTLFEVLGLHADWEDHSTWPTWSRLMARTGWSRSSTAGWLAELQRLGWLRRLERGTTPQFRPMALQHVQGNRAAVYQLCIPAEEAAAMPASALAPADLDKSADDQTWTPSLPLKALSSRNQVVPTRANTRIHNSGTNPQVTHIKVGPNGPRLDEEQHRFFDLRVPVTAPEMLAAAAELRADERSLWRLSSRWIRSLMKPWWRAGWTNADLRYALGHRPTIGGVRASLRCPASELRRPDGWIRHRLSHWRDERGPLVSPTADARTRAELVVVHGAAASARMPYAAAGLQPEDLAPSKAERAAAAEQLVRSWSREFHDRRDARRPDHEIADPASAERAQADFRALRAARRATTEQTTRPSPDPSPAAQTLAPAETTTPDTDQSRSDDVHRRALDLARSQGRIVRPRRHRRYFR